jgi:hypothetical protein
VSRMWESQAPGNKLRIEALKKVHDLGIKTFVSMEPTEIMEALNPWIERWIIGALNYMCVNSASTEEESQTGKNTLRKKV